MHRIHVQLRYSADYQKGKWKSHFGECYKPQGERLATYSEFSSVMKMKRIELWIWNGVKLGVKGMSDSMGRINPVIVHLDKL